MAVKLFLTSGAERILETADAARLEGAFFVVTRWHSEIRQLETILTLRAEDVVAADVLKDGVSVDYVRGRGRPPT
jgi:hypothetical protein